MHGLSRRSFLLGSGAAALLAACGSDDGGDGQAATTTTAPEGSTATAPTAASGGLVLGAAFDRNGLLIAGAPQRAPIVVFEEGGGLAAPSAVPASLTFELASEGGEALEPITVARHGDGIDRPYFPLVATFPSPGIYTARTEIGGPELVMTVNDPADVRVPQVGAPLPGAPTPTVADPRGVQTICTAQPVCPLHDVSLDDALGQGRPVAVLVSTPAFCQVAICGPVLDLLVAARASYPDMACIHVEVYPNGEPAADTLSPVVGQTFGLAYEPVLFAADAGGTVTARLDNIYDAAELDGALRSASA